ncbi:MAG: pbp2 [Chlamydiales bacterium]|jgi:cell division protein FtsI/penicillin-binding protein 2|nr:pbp2 [Chlamydiales bacterium]
MPIQEKANRVLHFILIGMIILLFRLWYLTMGDGSDRQEAIHSLGHKLSIDPAPRAEVVDRFQEPLAVNKIRYRVSVVYSKIRQIRAIEWRTIDNKKVKVFKRHAYIRSLAEHLFQETGLSSKRVEDLIYSHAVFYDQMPFILKDSITEEEYYRLKVQEKDWPGLLVEKVPSRFYPKGKVAADLIGYLGAINHGQYAAITQEIRSLRQLIGEYERGEEVDAELSFEEATARLEELSRRAYTVNDRVGKAGVESYFEEFLRGLYGRRSFLTDAQGNFLKDLPGEKSASPGSHFQLSLSSELQQFAEELLAENEKVREGRSTLISHDVSEAESLKQPWVKGGSIVALDPITGEVLALASHPRYDPNDFEKAALKEERAAKDRVLQWLENESYIAKLWDQREPLSRELAHAGKFYEETRYLSWEWYLELILPSQSGVRAKIAKATLNEAIEIERALKVLQEGAAPLKEALKKVSSDPSESAARQILAPYFEGIDDERERLLLLDLLRLAVDGDLFSDHLIALKGQETLSHYRDLSGSLFHIEEYLKEQVQPLFRDHLFAEWRKEHEKEFLRQKRREEKEKKQWAKPYLDYFDQKERELFADFWQQQRWSFLLAFLDKEDEKEEQEDRDPLPFRDALAQWSKSALSSPVAKSYSLLLEGIKELDEPETLAYLQTMRRFKELTRPLYGRYPIQTEVKNTFLEKDLARAFYRLYSPGYHRNLAYRQPVAIGSIFKLVVAYEALIERYRHLSQEVRAMDLNPLTIHDQVYRIGKRWYVGYREGGEAIPQIYQGGRIPRSAAKNIGRVDIVRAIETSSNPYFALLAGEVIESPDALLDAAKSFGFGAKTGITLPMESPGKLPSDLAENRTGLYSFAIGQHAFTSTPLQAAVMLSALVNEGHVLQPQLLSAATLAALPKGVARFKKAPRAIFCPAPIRSLLLQGMRRVMDSIINDRSALFQRYFKQQPNYPRYLKAMAPYMIGKSSTSEVMERLDIDFKGPKRYRHTWFGGISFSEEGQALPELVVVVHLRFSGYGREAAPLAAAMALKWREIQAAHASQASDGE